MWGQKLGERPQQGVSARCPSGRHGPECVFTDAVLSTKPGNRGSLAAVQRGRVHWGWVLIGLAFMVGAHVAVYMLIGSARIRAMVNEDPVTAFIYAASTPLVIFFSGGLIVGRLSPGRTIQEPAVAGLLGVVVLFGLQLLAGMINIFGLLIGTPFCFGMAYFGGWTGEAWQDWSERKRARRADAVDD